MSEHGSNMIIDQLDTDAQVQIGRGSYMPVLMRIMEMTTGPVFELGCGYVSTPYLHWACFLSNRKLVSFENDPTWYAFANRFSAHFHTIVFVEDWDKVDLSGECEVALVDHSPNERRKNDIPRLAHVHYIIIHDTDHSTQTKYRFGRVIARYRYRYKYTCPFGPSTTLVSNVHDLRDFKV